jgi:hypothetical protein
MHKRATRKTPEDITLVDTLGRVSILLLKYVECAECGNVLLGDSYREMYDNLPHYKKVRLPPPVRHRLKGRPYCERCAICKVNGHAKIYSGSSKI